MELTFRRPLIDDGVQRFDEEKVDNDASIGYFILNFVRIFDSDRALQIYLNHIIQHNRLFQLKDRLMTTILVAFLNLR